MKEKVLKILNELKPGIDFEHEDNYIENGYITSLEMIRLIVMLSEEFDVEITPFHIIPENFKNIESICLFIEKLENE